MLGSVPGTSALELTQKYKERLARLEERKKSLSEKSKVEKELKEVATWFQIAYDTLRTPGLAQIYY